MKVPNWMRHRRASTVMAWTLFLLQSVALVTIGVVYLTDALTEPLPSVPYLVRLMLALTVAAILVAVSWAVTIGTDR